MSVTRDSSIRGKREFANYQVFYSGDPNAYVGQTGRQRLARAKEHNGAVRRQDEISLRALHDLASGHAFDCATGYAIIFLNNNPQLGYFGTVNFAYAQSAITQAVAGYTGDLDRMHSARSKFPVQLSTLCRASHQIE